FLKLIETQLLQLLLQLNRTHHDLPDDLVRLSKRHALSHEIICKLGRIHIPTRRRRPRSIFVDSDIPHHRRRHFQTRLHRIERIEHRFLVFLHIFVVCEWQTLQGRKQSKQITKNPACLPTHELHRIRILLLRHQTRPRRDRIAEREEPKLARSVENDVFSKPRQVDHYERARAQELDTEISIAHSVETVPRNSFKPQRARQGLAIDRERRARQGRRAERQNVHATPHFRESLAVARKHFEVSQAPVGQQHGLRSLQVRVSRNHYFAMRVSKLE